MALDYYFRHLSTAPSNEIIALWVHPFMLSVQVCIVSLYKDTWCVGGFCIMTLCVGQLKIKCKSRQLVTYRWDWRINDKKTMSQLSLGINY